MLVGDIDRDIATEAADPAASLDIVPEAVVPAGPRRSRLRTAVSVLAAIVSHVGFAFLFLFLLQWRDLAVPPDNVIPVEVVARMPGDAGGAGGQGGQGGQASPPAEAAPPATTGPAGQTMPAAQASPGDPAGKPAQAASTAPSETPPAASEARPKDTVLKPPPSPQLVEPPPEPSKAATQASDNKAANTAPEPPRASEPKLAQPPAEAPQVLSAAGGRDPVAPAAPPKPDAVQQPVTASSVPAKDPAAELAAALPMDVAALPSSFRAVLSGGGQFHTDDYKGVVFGKLGRSQAASEAARARHLRGAVLVSFAVDDGGKVVDLKIVHSSGTPAVDALALQMVNDAAPFPPPPPDSKRVFTPVLSFGADQ